MQQVLYRHQPLTHIRVHPGLNEGNAPVIDVAIEGLDAAATGRQRKVVRQALVIVQKILLDQIAAIAQAQDEILVTKVCVVAH